MDQYIPTNLATHYLFNFFHSVKKNYHQKVFFYSTEIKTRLRYGKIQKQTKTETCVRVASKYEEMIDKEVAGTNKVVLRRGYDDTCLKG